MDYEGSFQDYVGHFLAGRAPYGSWWDFNRAYLENKEDYNILFLTYEELSRDKVACIRKISEFLGYQSISVEQVEVVDKATRFEAMAGTQKPIRGGRNKEAPGGRSKSMLSDNDREEIVKKTNSMLQGLEDMLPDSYFTK